MLHVNAHKVFWFAWVLVVLVLVLVVVVVAGLFFVFNYYYFFPNSVLSVGLYHVFGNSLNSENQLKLLVCFKNALF